MGPPYPPAETDVETDDDNDDDEIKICPSDKNKYKGSFTQGD